MIGASFGSHDEGSKEPMEHEERRRRGDGHVKIKVEPATSGGSSLACPKAVAQCNSVVCPYDYVPSQSSSWLRVFETL
jgi:hypothetical protein